MFWLRVSEGFQGVRNGVKGAGTLYTTEARGIWSRKPKPGAGLTFKSHFLFPPARFHLLPIVSTGSQDNATCWTLSDQTQRRALHNQVITWGIRLTLQMILSKPFWGVFFTIFKVLCVSFKCSLIDFTAGLPHPLLASGCNQPVQRALWHPCAKPTHTHMRMA